MRGLNSCKGVCRSREDHLDEIADVIITAAVAISAAADNGANGAAAHPDVLTAHRPIDGVLRLEGLRSRHRRGASAGVDPEVEAVSTSVRFI